MDMNEMLAAMMGGGMGGMMGGGRPQRRRGQNVGIRYPVTLEDLYSGKVTSVPREKEIICPDCKGSGSCKPGMSAQCPDCRGQGRRMAMRQMGNMITQQVVSCGACSGTGTKMDPKDKCKTCSAKRTISKEMPLSVNIERGMTDGEQIPFPGEGDQSPDIDEPGAIVIVLQQKEHEHFKREKDDLRIKQTLSLADALCGFQFVVQHLDGRKLVVKSTPGQMIKPGDIKCVVGEGMPVKGKPGKFGDLIIEFNIVFPDRLQQGDVEQLLKVLPAPVRPDVDLSEAEVHYVSRAPLEEVRKQMNKEDDDDEDDGQHGGGGVQCASH